MRDKQEKFCIEYLIDLNATQAAIRSGYSEKTARQMGTENLSKPVIQERIAELRLQASAESGVTPARVLKELGRIAFADPRNVMRWGAKGVELIDSATLSDDDAATVAEASETKTKGGGSIRLKMHDKVAALDKIARHLGMFVDKHEVTGKGGEPLCGRIIYVGE
jgi:phage terminase small subunit